MIVIENRLGMKDGLVKKNISVRTCGYYILNYKEFENRYVKFALREESNKKILTQDFYL